MEIIPEDYTRVSSILSIFQSYNFVPRDKLKKACELGTSIHDAVELYFKDGFCPLDKVQTPYFHSFLTWIESANLKPIETEKRYFDDTLMITGKIDLIAMIDGVTTLVDFKTGSWAHPEIWRLQATFYRHLAKEHKIDRFLFVQLMKNGCSPMLYPMEYDERDWTACLNAIECYHYFSRNNHG